MKTKFRYETPMLVNLSAESALGELCASGLSDDYICNDGSCPAQSQCARGTAAQACYTNGINACSANENCIGCCSYGDGPGEPYPCACNQGFSATWQCDYGGNDSMGCGGGGNFGNCY